MRRQNFLNIITDRGLAEIDRKEIDDLISAKKFIGLNKNPREEKIFISLTTYPRRVFTA